MSRNETASFCFAQALKLDSLPDPGSTYVLSTVRPRRGYTALKLTSIDRPTQPADSACAEDAKAASETNAAAKRMRRPHHEATASLGELPQGLGGYLANAEAD
jgi:hypothetical protein